MKRFAGPGPTASLKVGNAGVEIETLTLFTMKVGPEDVRRGLQDNSRS